MAPPPPRAALRSNVIDSALNSSPLTFNAPPSPFVVRLSLNVHDTRLKSPCVCSIAPPTGAKFFWNTQSTNSFASVETDQTAPPSLKAELLTKRQWATDSAPCCTKIAP